VNLYNKIALSLAITFCSALGFSQGSSNLGFSQVLNYEYNSSNIGGYQQTTVGSITVPSGKVWKITSGSCIINPNNSYGCSMRIGNNIVFQDKGTVQGGGSVNNTPVWLSSGTYSVEIGSFAGITASFRGAISGVEFNIE
tara:strand:+ start:29 stop:448 length:420 start_codon:yes stop_codon:yes gene_type:complete